MSTQRLISDQIISSGSPGGTERGDETIISSTFGSPKIISSSLGDVINLNGYKYDIVNLITRSGEAEIYLVSKDGGYFVFKYYYPQFKPKDEILKKLKGLKHPDIIGLIEYGFYQDRFFEISEYAQGGTLAEIMPVNSFQKIREIVAEILEALNYCHSHGIIHRDIKPENIFYRTPDKRDIAIGDFGIASNVKEGEEYVQTTLARTSLYAAPELFMNSRGKTTIEKSVDYYALGMSLLHMWFGRNPFEDAGGELAEMRLKSEGRVKFPGNIDKNVEKLIKGLITVNPLDRWSYDEVKRWLRGEDVKVNFQTLALQYKPYPFGLIDMQQIIVDNPKDLASYLEKYPEKGEGHLYRNTIAKWIEPVDPGLYNDLMDIVEKEYPRDRAAGLAKAIYVLDNEKEFTGFDRVPLNTQEEIALYFECNFGFYKEDLQNRNAAFYVFLEARDFKEEADKFRGYFKSTNAEAALNTIILELQGSDRFLVGDYTIYQPEELLRVDIQTKKDIINQLSNINSKLSVWIAGFPELQPTIDKWRLLKRYDEITLRYALQDGFRLNGSVVGDKVGFQKLILNNYPEFFVREDAKNLQHEADYWLKNYVGNSLHKILIENLLSEKFTVEQFEQLFRYIIENAGIDKFYDKVSTPLKPFDDTLINDLNTKINKINERIEQIEAEKESININNQFLKKNDISYLDELETERKSLNKQMSDLQNKLKNEEEDIIHFNETGNDSIDLFQVISLLLPVIKEVTENNKNLFDELIEITKTGIEKDWSEQIHKTATVYLDCLRKFLNFCEKANHAYPIFIHRLTLRLNDSIGFNIRYDYTNQIANNLGLYRDDLKKVIQGFEIIYPEIPFLNRYKKENTYIREKNSQITLANVIEKKQKEKILDDEYAEIIAKRKGEISRNFVFNVAVPDKENLPFITAIIGAILAVVSIFSSDDLLMEKIVGAIFAVPFGALLFFFIGSLIRPILVAILKTNAEESARKQAVDKVCLDINENAAYNSSLAKIEEWFKLKESSETHNEMVRILLLEDLQFENEFSDFYRNN